MNEQKFTQLSPWEPYRLLSFFLFITVFGAGVLLGINWKRLGKPEWMWKTILLSILLPATMIACIIGWILLLIDGDFDIRLVMSFPVLGMSINFAYLWALAWLQNGAYKKFIAEGSAVLQGYNYDVDKAMFLGGMIAIGMSVVLIIVIPLLP